MGEGHVYPKSLPPFPFIRTVWSLAGISLRVLLLMVFSQPPLTFYTCSCLCLWLSMLLTVHDPDLGLPLS